jgi:uncharacterized SAM-binding protein YcdF (DUF218 family)
MGLLETSVKYGSDPVVITLLMLATAIALERNRNFRTAKGLIVAATGFLLVFVLLPVGALVAKPLEDLYPRPVIPDHIDGIVILSGGLDIRMFESRGVPGQDDSASRLVAGAELARRFPNAKLIFSGAESPDVDQQILGADVAEKRLIGLGVAAGRAIFENRSLNTWENIVNSMALAHPQPNEIWVLVTYAVHMPRAMGVATKLDWKMVPWPSEYLSTHDWAWWGLGQNPSFNAFIAYRAVHEWLGLIAYRLEGRL